MFDAARVGDFVARGLGQVLVPPYTALGFETLAGNITFGAVFTEWNGASLEVSIYGPGGMRRAQIVGMAVYAFQHVKATRLTARTRRSNKAMRTMLPRFGFTYEGTMRRLFGPTPADDGFVYGMLPENAQRWLKWAS